jgi:glycosyltransferase involved in cell wall biosynthesis
MKLSIIIPVYNVEAYIAKCLDSIIAQDLEPGSYEIIVVNDGSPDDSGKIAQEFAAQHTNIIFIDQENQGVSVARNRGLDVAKGNYIAFIDPDDSIYPNCLNAIIEVAEKNNLDILYLNLDAFDEAGKFLLRTESNGSSDIVLDGFRHPRRTYISTLYRRKVIDGIRFKKGIIRGQDTVFNLMVQSKAERCSYSPIPYYKYLQRSSSSRQFVGTEKNFISILLAIETIKKFKIENFPDATTGQEKYFDEAMLTFIQRTLEWIVFPQANKSTFNRLKDALREMELDYLITETARKYRLFNKPFAFFMLYRKSSGLFHALKSKLQP